VLKLSGGQPNRSRQLIKKLSIWLLVLAVAGLIAVPVFAQVRGHPPAQPSGLDVQPFPGTPDASPQTAISFPALSPSQIRTVMVTGSRSGIHGGGLSPLPDGRGTAFTPGRPFANAERVTVRASLRSASAGAASGARGTDAISFSFGVAAPLPNPRGAVAGMSPQLPTVRHDVRDANGFTHSFRSAPGLHPPIQWLSGADPDPGSGYIFGDAQNTIQPGPIILDPAGHLVWFEPLHQSAALDVQVQRYQGQSVLTFWQGYVIPPGVGVGRGVILDHSYQTIATVTAGNGYQADLHEFQITSHGTALLTAYAPVKASLQSVGGPRNGSVLDCIVQEVDIATGKVLWEWHAFGHVHLAESYAGKPTAKPYDFFHVNSVQQLPNGNLLVSARHTSGVYEINKHTGKIVWVLGGKHSSFKVGKGANFAWQHDAQMLPDGTITVFDNGAGLYKSESQSRALRIRLSGQRATLVRGYAHKPSLLSENEGNVQVLPDGNLFVGFGSSPYFSEFRSGGRQLFSIRMKAPLQSYRAYRFGWWGQPTSPPSISVSPSTGRTRVYASWNGATAVASWQVLAGPNPGALTPVASGQRSSFETVLSTPNPGPYYAVRALASDGRTLGTSPAVQS
jgi:hypothetical protein